MKRYMSPARVEGTLIAPASKSVIQRAVIAATLAHGESRLTNITLCDDARAAISVAEALGAKVTWDNHTLLIESPGIADKKAKSARLFCGESGLLTRMIIPIASLLSDEIEISGHGSLLSRPMDMITGALSSLGVAAKTNGGNLPVTVRGPLQGGHTVLDGSVSSQFLTGLLMALPMASCDSELYVTGLKSKPYIDITVRVLHDFGVKVENHNYEVFNIQGNQCYTPTDYNIEGDWSGASCLLVGGAIAGEVSVNNLDLNSVQADRAIVSALERSGAPVDIITDGQGICTVHTQYTDKLTAFEFDATECPDLFPALVTLAANCRGTSLIKGTRRLRHKESDRAVALRKEFGKLGIEIGIEDDMMTIRGGKIKGGEVYSHNDHRIAMALAVAALRATNEIVINGAESVGKSYPDFWEDLQKITFENNGND